MDDELLRKLQIGFMDSLSLETRHRYILEGASAGDIIRKHDLNLSYIQSAEDVVDWLNKSDENRVIWYSDEDFPVFRNIERRLPYMLFYKGTFKKRNKKSVSIVGTRQVDNEGFQTSFKLGLEAGINDISVVSGLADGCDQASLNGCAASGYPSYGIIGCGLEIDYPLYSDKLKHEMIEGGGAVISRFSPNYPPLRYNFPNRNLIIAAMGDCTVVVQAPKKSGSLITCDMALQLGKDVYVSNAGLGSMWCRLGSSALADDGACVINGIGDFMQCNFAVDESKSKEGLRFGNKHYFIRAAN